jgi:hypothetical protein
VSAPPGTHVSHTILPDLFVMANVNRMIRREEDNKKIRRDKDKDTRNLEEKRTKKKKKQES